MNWQTTASATLENEHVMLRPVREDDRESIRALARDSHIWRYFVFRVSSEEEFENFFNAMLSDQATGTRAVFIVVDKASGQIAGSMSFGNMVEKEARLEIGWSWLGEAFRGKGINRWAKYLLMRHAFEVLGVLRVEFKTDVLNLQARAGLRNIGAKEEGVLRSFNFMPDGRRRDAVFYSVLADEWPQVSHSLQHNAKVSHRPEVQ
ncbi:GNAT family N-acetyltransferase [Enterobacillus tribolii]|uniref:RimJ/RimL family protein N-acetyltransferase n=1 Tax=Enterobacillus tribolii TaxID=1487935 RepID=A0A370R0W8_9GAMM|nr:GNAT family protein [Enterobacillus tribolii]MBW7982875.1 N-acetyltransferase [Enterobacillus tribolii]RDK95564.1 RimJ/RimL family protein N-acetyltransferase [Enterobacillus tribolii]